MKYKGDPRRRRGHLPASFSASAYASFFFAPSSDAARLDASLGDVPASIISFSASSKPAPVDLSDSFSPAPRDPSTTSVISPRGWRVSNSAIASDSVPLQNSS